MFIQTEATPNPDSLKFIPGREVLGAGGRDFPAAGEAEAVSPLAMALFGVEGVRRVYLGADFITITKAEGHEWAHLKPFVLGAIMEHFVAGLPVLADAPPPAADGEDGRTYEGEAAEIVDQIKDLIETRVRPAVAQDGGDITFHSWDNDSGIVRLRLRGSCAGCPSSIMTLKQGIENMLRHYVPEVNAVEQVM
jgi:NFU1 iron-sulfur cluster scaffold homolog, mitochondrial